MIKKIKQAGDWTCFADTSQCINIPDIQELLANIADFSDVLKHDKRSLVKTGTLMDMVVLAKSPMDKNNRKWSRFLSLFRTGEALKTLQSQWLFKQIGIPSVRPVLSLEKRYIN